MYSAKVPTFTQFVQLSNIAFHTLRRGQMMVEQSENPRGKRWDYHRDPTGSYCYHCDIIPGTNLNCEEDFNNSTPCFPIALSIHN